MRRAILDKNGEKNDASTVVPVKGGIQGDGRHSGLAMDASLRWRNAWCGSIVLLLISDLYIGFSPEADIRELPQRLTSRHSSGFSQYGGSPNVWRRCRVSAWIFRRGGSVPQVGDKDLGAFRLEADAERPERAGPELVRNVSRTNRYPPASGDCLCLFVSSWFWSGGFARLGDCSRMPSSIKPA
jgi:hypothetical protein